MECLGNAAWGLQALCSEFCRCCLHGSQVGRAASPPYGLLLAGSIPLTRSPLIPAPDQEYGGHGGSAGPLPQRLGRYSQHLGPPLGLRASCSTWDPAAARSEQPVAASGERQRRRQHSADERHGAGRGCARGGRQWGPR